MTILPQERQEFIYKNNFQRVCIRSITEMEPIFPDQEKTAQVILQAKFDHTDLVEILPVLEKRNAKLKWNEAMSELTIDVSPNYSRAVSGDLVRWLYKNNRIAKNEAKQAFTELNVPDKMRVLEERTFRMDRFEKNNSAGSGIIQQK